MVAQLVTLLQALFITYYPSIALKKMPSKEFNRICAFGFFSQIYICIDHYTSSPKSKHFIAKKLKKKKKLSKQYTSYIIATKKTLLHKISIEVLSCRFFMKILLY